MARSVFSVERSWVVLPPLMLSQMLFFESPLKAQELLFAKASNAWLSGITYSGLIEGGIMANPARPSNGINFGDFLADHANQVQLNQVSVKLNRPLDAERAQEYQIGFTLQGLYGSDARYYHLLGVSNHLIDARYQLIPAQAHVDVHVPWLSQGGVDMQAGILQAPMGVETLDPTTRPLYTLAYTSQYAVPFEHLGAMFQWHISQMVTANFGIDTGNQTTWGRDDDNNAPAGYFGINIDGLAHKRLSLHLLSRIGPEDSVNALGREANRAERYWNDLSVIYRPSERLTLTQEINFMHDVGLRAETYSFVSFVDYVMNDRLSLHARGEVFRDNSGVFVLSFLTNQGYMNAFLNGYAPVESAPPTTYGALTLGATWHPVRDRRLEGFALRPEIRFDRSLNGTTPFNGLRNAGMFTFGGDALIAF